MMRVAIKNERNVSKVIATGMRFWFFLDQKVKRQLVELFALLALPVLALGENPQPDPSLCGPYPKHYKETVWNWLESTLLDADSAKIEWEGDPKPADFGRNGEHLYGWLVNSTVNS